MDHDHEHHCNCGCSEELSEEDMVNIDKLAEEAIFGKNQNRSRALRELWFDDINRYLQENDAPEESKPELLFLSLSNALLDMFFDIVPRDIAIASANNMSRFLATLLVNKEYDVDTMEKYMHDYESSVGNTQDLAVIDKFEEDWWNEKKDYLNGKTMSEVMEEILEKYGL